MKNKHYLYILPLCAIFLFNGKKYDESVIERIHLDVNICIEGQECGAGAKNKIERGPQSALMYAQAAALSDSDIKELSKYIVSL